jgi:hypothetical protein
LNLHHGPNLDCADSCRRNSFSDADRFIEVLGFDDVVATKLFACFGKGTRGSFGGIMKYMLLVYMNEQAMNDEERQHCYVESAKLTQDLHASGHYVAASPLHSVSTATSVQIRDGKRVVTDGIPYKVPDTTEWPARIDAVLPWPWP